MKQLSSLIIEHGVGTRAYYDSPMCPSVEPLHEQSLSSQSGCLIRLEDHILGHVKYSGKLSFLSWTDTIGKEGVLRKGSLYHIDTPLFSSLYIDKQRVLSENITGWQVKDVDTLYLRFIRSFNPANANSSSSIQSRIADAQRVYDSQESF